MPTTLAFIGMGIMGQPMAARLLDAGHTVFIHTRTKSRATKLVNRGAKWIASPAEAATKADTVFLCLPDTPDVEAALLGPNGVIHSARPGLVLIDHSTISPAATRSLAEMFASKGTLLLDAPVSGGDIGAKNGSLSIMVGGDPKAFERVEPLLRTMGKTITYTGPSGTGQLTKLVNQILVSVTNLAVCEALTFARKHGLDPEKTLESVTGGAAGSWQLSNLGPRMLAGDFRPGFMIKLQQKDLRLVLQAAEQANISLPAASLVHQLFSAAEAAGQGNSGTQALFTVLEKLSSLH